jgi:hypothetical protein
VRTDLDSFSDAEAYALMTSGYRMAEFALETQKCVPSLHASGSRQPWKFLATEDALTGANGTSRDRMHTLLSVSKELAGKVWRQLMPLKIFAGLLGVALVGGAGYALWKNRDYVFPSLPPLWVLVAIVAALFAAKFILAQLDKRRHYHKRLGEMGLGFAIAFAGWIVAGLHLLIFDRMFLHHGRWSGPPEPTVGIDTGGPRVPVAKPGGVSKSGGTALPPPNAGGKRPQDQPR